MSLYCNLNFKYPAISTFIVASLIPCPDVLAADELYWHMQIVYHFVLICIMHAVVYSMCTLAFVLTILL